MHRPGTTSTAQTAWTRLGKAAEHLRKMEPPFCISQIGDGCYTTCGIIMMRP